VKRRDEIVVGITILAAVAMAIAGAVWLAERDVFGTRSAAYIARFRSVGGLGVGNPVVLRGVRVGRVEQIRLADQGMVEADLQVYQGVTLPDRPAIIAASASFFGEWQAEIISLEEAPDDPNVLRELELVTVEDDIWPGATLPDIGQLTAQAGRIASDIATVSSRIQTAFDSQAVAELQSSIRQFGQIADRLSGFMEAQTGIMEDVGSNLQRGSEQFADAATFMQTSFARVDTATQEGELTVILDNIAEVSGDIRGAANELSRIMAALGDNEATLERLFQGADTLITRLQDRGGTAGLLLGDSALYREATLAVVELRALLADIKANPRKYFKFSVF
jgi:phospholipid/cholesterol/gamma-HCH transport system substrate-binding protein